MGENISPTENHKLLSFSMSLIADILSKLTFHRGKRIQGQCSERFKKHANKRMGSTSISLTHIHIYTRIDNSQKTRFMGPTWDPPGSCQPQMGPMLAPWTLLSWNTYNCCVLCYFVLQILVERTSKLILLSVKETRMTDWNQPNERSPKWHGNQSNVIVSYIHWESCAPAFYSLNGHTNHHKEKSANW